MKSFTKLSLGMLLAVSLASPFAGLAEDAKAKPTPYPLNTCIVSGEKFGGDMGDPYVFIYHKTKGDAGREIKFCCKDCVKDFKKDPDSYVKKIDEAAAKAKAKTTEK